MPADSPTTREKLLTAMSRSLQIRGFGATSMKELLETTGVSSGSMYHSFPGGKEELAVEAIRNSGLSSADRIRDVFTKAPSVADGVGLIFGALARDLERSRFRYGCPIGVPATEAAAVSDDIQRACGEVFDAWVAAYRDALVVEAWPEPAAATQALAIVTAYEGSLTIARALKDTTPIANIGDDLVARISAGSPPGPTSPSTSNPQEDR